MAGFLLLQLYNPRHLQDYLLSLFGVGRSGVCLAYFFWAVCISDYFSSFFPLLITVFTSQDLSPRYTIRAGYCTLILCIFLLHEISKHTHLSHFKQITAVAKQTLKFKALGVTAHLAWPHFRGLRCLNYPIHSCTARAICPLWTSATLASNGCPFLFTSFL